LILSGDLSPELVLLLGEAHREPRPHADRVELYLAIVQLHVIDRERGRAQLDGESGGRCELTPVLVRIDTVEGKELVREVHVLVQHGLEASLHTQ
jgi:hypothetical protein